MKARIPYSHEFTVEAIKLVTVQGLTPHKLVRDLGIDPQPIWRWMRTLR